MTDSNLEEQPQAEVQFMIQRVYVKDLSFEAPKTPQIFQEKWDPQLNLDISVTHTELEAGVYEVVLNLTANVVNNTETAFLVEIKQAGIFTIQGAAIEQKDHLLESFCPNILFPYARETITSQVIRGSFPQLVLSPINFDALYMQKLEERNKASQTAEEIAH